MNPRIISVSVVEYSNKKQLRGERAYSAYSPKSESIILRKSRQT